MKRSFIYLLVLTVLAVLAVWMFAINGVSPQKNEAGTLLLPGISDRINDVARLEIVTAGNHPVATLIRTDDRWQLQEMGGYRADWPKLQALMAGLATARVVETKTDKPEYYARLGVEDVDSENAGSILVRLGSGEQVTGVLLGHRAQGRAGQFVRLQGTAGSVLIDQELDVPTRQSDWVDAGIVDINASEVAEVEIIHPGGDRLLVMRISADQTDFDLAGLPPGREIKSSWAVNSLASVFSMLNMETVRREDAVDWSDAVRMRLLMFSGVEIMADILAVQDEHLLRLKASHPAAKVVGSQAADQPDSEAQQALEKQAADDVAKRVDDINQKVTGWIYGISRQKYDAMVKKPEDLLQPLEP